MVELAHVDGREECSVSASNDHTPRALHRAVGSWLWRVGISLALETTENNPRATRRAESVWIVLKGPRERLRVRCYNSLVATMNLGYCSRRCSLMPPFL